MEYATNALVQGNTIMNPVAGIANAVYNTSTQPFSDPAGIYLKTVAGLVSVRDNKILNADTRRVPQVSLQLTTFSAL